MARGSPWELAAALGITIEETDSGTFRVGTVSNGILVQSHVDHEVREARAWEGIAQWLLVKSGTPWTADTVRNLARKLRGGSGTWDRVTVTARNRAVKPGG